jgi:hypothetical protein
MNPQQPLPVTQPQSIFAQIRFENDQFLYNFISPIPGYAFNQYLTLKRIYLYLSNRFENGAYYLGREKLFYNIVTPAVEVASKMLNVDTKDIRLVPQNPTSYFPTYLLEKELHSWLKTSQMGHILNQIAEEAPRYGSVLLEKTKDGAKVCDLRRTMLDPSVENAKDSRFITTISYMSDTELLKTGWKDADIAVARFANTQAAQPFEDQSGNLNIMRSSPQVKIYKRYGEVPRWWLDGSKGKKGDEMVRSLFIVAGPDFLQRNASGQATGELGVVLYKSEWRGEYPFKDFHYNKIKGRWLGMGVVETLFDVQARFNEMKNQKRLSMEISALHLFQTKDKQLVRNVLTDLESGDVIFSPNGVEPIANEERNLPAFKEEEESYGAQVDKLTFAYEAVRGETAGNGNTPLGIAQIAVAQATSVYGFKRQNLTIFLREFFDDLVMPQLMRDLTPEHIMRFTGSTQELDKLDQAAATLHVNDLIKKKVLNGEKVDIEFQQMAQDSAVKAYRKTGSNRFLKIKEAFYKDAEFDFDLNDSEQTDPNQVIGGIQFLFSLLQNPAILQDPRLKLLFYQAAEKFGISPAEMEFADNQATEMTQNGQLPTLTGQQGGAPPGQGQPKGQPSPMGQSTPLLAGKTQ